MIGREAGKRLAGTEPEEANRATTGYSMRRR
jgi:hypothetical protein